jgi:hypothetical protein
MIGFPKRMRGKLSHRTALQRTNPGYRDTGTTA